MKRTIIIAHPAYEKWSKNTKNIVELIISRMPEIDVRVLKFEGNFNIEEEQKYLLKYDEIFFAFPTWWYTSPSNLKKYIDDVLTPGFGFSFKGDINEFKLLGKKFGIITSVGNVSDTYREENLNVADIDTHNMWLRATFHLISTGSAITGKTSPKEVYMYDTVISWGAAINADNTKNNKKAVEKFISMLK